MRFPCVSGLRDALYIVLTVIVKSYGMLLMEMSLLRKYTKTPYLNTRISVRVFASWGVSGRKRHL